MGKIIQLDQYLANQIAAGEVVERPVSVVKELLENSLDAGATSIKVEIEDGGKKRITLSDNGEGIEKEDLEICLQKYTTSKIKNLQDLYHVMTFGFRGEALSSISSVSHFEIITKTSSSLEALHLKFDTLSGQKISSISGNQGTQIVVQDLFYNTPARLNYLKTSKTEATKIQDYIESMALSHPEVSFEFVNEGKRIFFYPENQSLSQRVYEIYGNDVFENMLEVSYEAVGFKITGFMSDPKVSFGNKNRQNVFVNHRPIFSPLISKAMSDAYNRFIPHGTYPAFVIHLDVDPTAVDVNVHPRKQEVRFADENAVFRGVYHAFLNRLEKVSLISNTGFGDVIPEQNFSQNTFVPQNFQEKNIPSSLSYYTGSGTKFQSYSPYKNTQSNPDQINISQGIEFTKNILQDTKNDVFSQENSGDLHYTKLGKIIGQAFFSYILVEREGKLVILDQHALAERVIYEKLLKKQTLSAPQTFLVPEVIKLTPHEFDTLETHKDIFFELGFDFQILSHQMISLQSMPNFIKKQDVKEIFSGILGDILAGNLDRFQSLDEVKNKIFAYTACRSAIKFGNKLNLFEMNALLNESLDSYTSTCPHGRPVIFEMTLDELKNKYER